MERVEGRLVIPVRKWSTEKGSECRGERYEEDGKLFRFRVLAISDEGFVDR